MAGDAAVTPEYDAFVSYSRRDIAFARALEKALKAYRPPRDLAVPQRYLRVFRDEADFTGAEYTRAIRRHLAASRALIVVCSPAARASRYVDEEIRLFAESHGAATVIPVLVGGVPNNEAGPGRESELAFPDALLRLMAMPLAVEYRGVDAGRARLDRGAQEGSWFKLLADLYGLSRHEVEQREKRRQARTRRRWIGGTAVVMASLVALSVWALVSRAEAIRQREIAAAGLVTAQARALVGPETEVAERQALLALEALRRLRQHGGATDDAEAVLAEARSIAGDVPADINILPAQNRRKRLLIADMDSTIVTCECLDELAGQAGLKEKVAAITERAMRGELEFAAALRERVALLKGLPFEALSRTYAERVRLNPGARNLVGTMRAHGAHTLLVSGGFTYFTSRVAEAAGFDSQQGNRLLDDGHALTGEVAEPILGREAKLAALQDAVIRFGISSDDALAVGDGAFEIFPHVAHRGAFVPALGKRR
jgi:phosphoserine phosphatase